MDSSDHYFRNAKPRFLNNSLPPILLVFMSYEQAALEISLQLPLVKTPGDLDQLKRKASQKYGLTQVVSNARILDALGSEEKEKYRPLLRTRRARSLSGVSVIAIMLKPLSCPY